jgi:hypothetical protein
VKKKIMIPGVLLSLVFVSCTDFFTSSWGTWAARDPANLIRNVSAGNVDEYITMAENNPDLSLELLKKIGGASGSASGSDKAKLQSAAVTAAINASNLTTTLMNNAADVSSLENTDDVKNLVTSTLNSMNNLTPASDALVGILEQDKAAFMASASADDMALAAVLILAGEAKKAGPDVFSDYENATIPPSSQPTIDFVEELATAALDKQQSGGGEDSELLKLLDALGFKKTTLPPP